MAFHQFANLPLELQIQVWEAYTDTGPAMHIFDVCFPSWKGETRAEKAFEESKSDKDARKRLERYKKTAFLDRLDSEEGGSIFDPSMYHATTTSRLINRAAYRTAKGIETKRDMNMVHLPGRAQKILIPSSDVLMLRLREPPIDHTQLATETLLCPPPIKEILESEWSAEMAATLHTATRIAIDVTETWSTGLHGELGLEEVAFFACTIQKGLEVLYLVDDCAGRCRDCAREDIKAETLQQRDRLWRGLQEDAEDESRPGDVVHAVSRRYVEVFDLEALGWEDEHPTYIFAKIINAAIRSQQEGVDKGRFQGVRVLVAEDQ
ncbi:hypothetical protein FDECE_15513 [Fusarium decemcellulare]|nr:hypothetical protein FDECE_15513 [Fusarium decemcellulare]